MKKWNIGPLALAIAIVAGTSAPALADGMKDHQMKGETSVQGQTSAMTTQEAESLSAMRADAFTTTVPALTYTAEENRAAAVSYMSDALKLLRLAEADLRAGNLAMARRELSAASGKATTAYLLNFEDRQFAAQIADLTMQIPDALAQVNADPMAAAAVVASIQPELASVYSSQLATMGGGAGAGFEDDLIEPEQEIIEEEQDR